MRFTVLRNNTAVIIETPKAILQSPWPVLYFVYIRLQMADNQCRLARSGCDGRVARVDSQPDMARRQKMRDTGLCWATSPRMLRQELASEAQVNTCPTTLHPVNTEIENGYLVEKTVNSYGVDVPVDPSEQTGQWHGCYVMDRNPNCSSRRSPCLKSHRVGSS
jgi:hypothetical protein